MVSRAPLILIVSGAEWSSLSLDAVLGPHGFVVVRAARAEHAMELARRAKPDAVIVEGSLPDAASAELIRRLRGEREPSTHTPIVRISEAPLPQSERLDILRAGAWEVSTMPLDAEELVLRLGHYTRAKIEAETIAEAGLVDPITGLYNWSGAVQRIREISASARRFGRPLSCIVLWEMDMPPDGPAADLERVAGLLRRGTRKSDIRARIGPREFAVVTPDTDAEGAGVLAGRLRSAGGEALDELRIGIAGTHDCRIDPIDPAELLVNASAASRSAEPTRSVAESKTVV